VEEQQSVDAIPAKEPQEEQVVSKEPKKKSFVGRIVKSILLFLLVVLIGGVLYAGWLGFIPGLSSLLGANKARDLGVSYSQVDIDSFLAKRSKDVLELNYADAPSNPSDPSYKYVFTDPVALDATFTQAEITGRINETKWSGMPFVNVQVRFNDGGNIELSGNILSDKIKGFIDTIGGVGYSEEDIDTALTWLNRMAGNPAIYINADVQVINNSLQLSINEAKINRWSAPLDDANQVLSTATRNALAKVAGLSIDSVTFDSAGLHFIGTTPNKVYVAQ